MDEPRLDAFAQRLVRLERENRWWKLVGVGALAMLGLVVLLGARGGEQTRAVEEVRARRFVLVDREGKLSAFLGTDFLGTAMGLFGNDGREIRISVLANGIMGLSIYGKGEKTLAFLGAGPNSLPFLAMSDKDEMPRATLSVLENGMSELALSNAGGRVRASLRAIPDGTPGLLFRDNDGRERGGLAMDKDGGIFLARLDRSGNLIWKAP